MWPFMTGFFSLNIMFSRFIHVVTYQYFIRFCGLIIFHGMDRPYFSIHQLMDIWVVSIWGLLWIMPLSTFQYKFLCGPVFPSLGYTPRIGITGSCGNCVFHILSSCQIVFHSGCTILLFHQQCNKASNLFHFVHILTNTCLFSVLVLVFIIAILMDVRWYLIVLLICIFLMISNVRIFSCAYWQCLYLLWRNIYSVLCPFLNWVVFFLQLISNFFPL